MRGAVAMVVTAVIAGDGVEKTVLVNETDITGLDLGFQQVVGSDQM